MGKPTLAAPFAKNHHMLALPRVLLLAPADLRYRGVNPFRRITHGHCRYLRDGQLSESGDQDGPGLMEPGLNSPDRDAKILGDLTVTQALQVEQQHGLPLAVRQGRDGPVHAGRDLGGLGRLGRAGQLRRLVGQARNLRPELFLGLGEEAGHVDQALRDCHPIDAPTRRRGAGASGDRLVAVLIPRR